MGKRLTQEDVKEKVKSLHNGEYLLISEYKTMNDPIEVLHIPCGNKYEIKRPKSFLNENEKLCPYCNKTKSHSTKKVDEEEFIKRLSEQVGDEYTYISGFVKMKQKVLLKHNLCGTEYEVDPSSFLGKRQRRCPICANKKRGKYAIKQNYLQSLLNEKSYGNEYEWLEDYKNNNKIKHKIFHKVCKNEYEVKPNDFQQGYLCPYCTANKSKEELEIYNFIKKYYDRKIIQSYKLNGYELDIYLPDLKLGFEFNGYYWHSNKFKDKNYHLNKKELFYKNGIDVIFIEELDWKNKKNIWKKKILHIIKKDNGKRIYARNTEIKYNLSYDKKREFLDRYHLQGNCHDSFNLYLTYENRIIALMTFGFHRASVNNKNKRMELIRYATSYNYIVIGGFSKLLKHAKEYILEKYDDYDYIYTFADRNISQGDVYYKNGFQLDHISKPSYYYVYKQKKYNRYKFRKSELRKLFPEYYDNNLTEFEITDKVKDLYRIFNCGNLVFKCNIRD